MLTTNVPLIGRATVDDVVLSDGVPMKALVTVGNQSNVVANLPMGMGSPVHRGDVWMAHAEGGPLSQEWTLTRKVSGKITTFGEYNDELVPTIVTVIPEQGGFYTESMQATLARNNDVGDPGSTPLAAVYIFFRSVVVNGYNLFEEQGIRQVYVQHRQEGDIEWNQSLSAVYSPEHMPEIYANAPIATDATSIPVTIPPSEMDSMLEGQLAFWECEGEIFQGRLNPYSVPPVIAVEKFTPPGKPERGIGFGPSDDSRWNPEGIPDTQAFVHPAGSAIHLVSAQTTLVNLRCNKTYEIRLAAVTRNNKPGPWSVIQSLPTWAPDIKPSAVNLSTFTVTHLSASILARWAPVNTDIENNARIDIKSYAVVRHTQPLPATLTLAEIIAAPYYATLVSAEQTALSVTVPASLGAGNHIGVAALTTGGVIGSWAWQYDNVPPPVPDPTAWSIQSTAQGPRVDISRDMYNVGQVGNDPGFKEFRLYRSASVSTAGSGPVYGRNDALVGNDPNVNLALVKVISNGAMSVLIDTDDPAILDYYQLTAVDWAGNETLCIGNGSYWKRDDGVPSAPVITSVVSIQTGIRLQWAQPAASYLKNVRYWRIKRASLYEAQFDYRLVDPYAGVQYVWNASDVSPANATFARSMLYFQMQAIDWNGKEGAWSGWVIDDVAPPPPAPANQIIRSYNASIMFQVNGNEHPEFDDSWREYVVLQASDASGTGSTPVSRFDGRQLVLDFPVWSSAFFQIVSGDWVGNYGVGVPGAWVQARSLYPYDPIYGIPANGDFQATDPRNANLPAHWDTGLFQHLNYMSPTQHRFSAFTYDSTGGYRSPAAMRGTLGSYLASGSDSNVRTLRTSTRMYFMHSKVYTILFYVKLPFNMTTGQRLDINFSVAFYANAIGGPVLDEIFVYESVNNPYTPNTWVPVDYAMAFNTPGAQYCELTVMSAGVNFGSLVGYDISFDAFSITTTSP